MRNDLRNETDKPALKAHFYQLAKSCITINLQKVI